LPLQIRVRPRGRHAPDRFFSAQTATVLYGATAASDAESLLAKLGKHSTGKGCLYIKKLADVDQKVLEDLTVKSIEASRKRYPA
jgi:hypothetical protein